MTEEGSEGCVYHLELRQFPHNVCRFNIPEGELREKVLVPWAQERWVEFGERKWSPHQATLTVLRGPRIPFGQLTMGRGWRAAQRGSREVTEELLAGVRGELAGAVGESVAARGAAPAVVPVASSGEPAVPAVSGSASQPLAGERYAAGFAADSLGLELLGQLGSEPAPLRRAWELAAARNPDAAASATLALAEGAVESLLRARLVELVRVAPASGEAAPVAGDEAAKLIRAAVSWAGADEADAVQLRRV